VRLTVRLTPEENQRLTQAAQERGYQAVAQFARASLARSVTQAQVIEEVHSLEKRQAATLSAVRTEIARFQRTEYVVFAMLENLSGVNYFFGWTTTISPVGDNYNSASPRVDSSLLLPSAARCLMKNVTRPSERDGWQIEEATEHDNETGTD
jgi:hypothetical protein